MKMHTLTSWLYLASSCLGYGLALMMPSLWSLMFITFVPFLVSAGTTPVSFCRGFVFGALLWLIGGFGILHSLFSMAVGSTLMRLASPVGIVLLQGICAALWFYLSTLVLRCTSIKDSRARCIFYAVALWGYFYWVVHYSLSMFNALEGYFLMSPLLPLASTSTMLTYLPALGHDALLALLLLVNCLIALWCITRSKKIIPLIGATLLIWTGGLLMPLAPHAAPTWLPTLGVLPKRYFLRPSLSSMAKEMQQDILLLTTQHPAVEAVLFPESAFQGVNLAMAQSLGSFWNEKSLLKPLSLIIGASKWEHDYYRNTIYWIKQGSFHASFNKRHAMALTEDIKGWYDLPFLRKQFHTATPPYTASDNARPVWNILDGVPFTPYICSELFFNDTPDDTHPQATILALCNDEWSSSSYIKYLMFLAARFKAIAWQRPIVYVAYNYTGYCMPDGTVLPLTQPDQAHTPE